MNIYGENVLEVVRHLCETYEGCFTFIDCESHHEGLTTRDYEIIELDQNLMEEDIIALFIGRKNDKNVYDGCIAFRADGIDRVVMYIFDYDTTYKVYKVFLSPSDMEYELNLFWWTLDDIHRVCPYSKRFNYLILIV